MKMLKAVISLALAGAMAFQFGSTAFALSLKKPAAAAPKKTLTLQLDKPKAASVTEEAKEYNYWASQLSDTEKKVYDKILATLDAKKTSINITLSATNSQQRQQLVTRVFKVIIKQHPEYYWLSDKQNVTWKLYSDKSVMTFKPQYAAGYDSAAANKTDTALKAVLDDIQKNLPEDEYGKVKYLYSWVLNNCVYNWKEMDANSAKGGPTTVDDYTAVGVMLKKSGVCQGYADTFQYLCDHFDITCITVYGDATYGYGNLDHSWNYVQLDGQWYLVDTTWADTFTNGVGMFLLWGTSNTVKGGVNVAKAYPPRNEGFTYPTLSEKAYSAK